MFTLIHGAEVYAPEYLGAQDLLFWGHKIIRIGENLEAPAGFKCDMVNSSGKIVYPGFVDNHVHLIGADDGQGPMGRTHDIEWACIVESAEDINEESIPRWKALSDIAPYGREFKKLFLYIPEGYEGKTLKYFEDEGINFDGIRGYRVETRC